MRWSLRGRGWGLSRTRGSGGAAVGKAKRGILNCTRQWGKSTMAAAKAVHRAYTRPGSLVLVASPTAAAERGVSAEGGGDGAEAGDPAARGWG